MRAILEIYSGTKKNHLTFFGCVPTLFPAQMETNRTAVNVPGLIAVEAAEEFLRGCHCEIGARAELEAIIEKVYRNGLTMGWGKHIRFADQENQARIQELARQYLELQIAIMGGEGSDLKSESLATHKQLLAKVRASGDDTKRLDWLSKRDIWGNNTWKVSWSSQNDPRKDIDFAMGLEEGGK